MAIEFKEKASTQQSGVQGGPGPSAPSAPTSSGRFTNLQSYLKANTPQDAAKQSMASTITGKVEEQGKQFGQQLKESGQQLKGNTDSFKENIQQLSGQYQQQLQQDPTKLDPTKFAQIRDVQYTGPQQLSNQYQLASQAEALKSTGGLVGSEAGRQQLLRQTFQAPGYTRGQTALDQAMLQANPQQLANLKAVQSIANKATQNLTKEQQAALQGIQAAKAAAQQTRGQVRGAIDTAAGSLQSELQRQADVGVEGSVAQQRQREYESAINRLQTGNLSPQDLQALGLSEGQQLYNVNLGDISGINQGQQATAQNVASAEQIAKINALKNLAGGTGSQTAEEFYSQQYGGLEKDPYTFASNAKDLVQNALSGARANFQGELNSGYQGIQSSVNMPGEWLQSMGQRSPEQNLQDLIAERQRFESGQYGAAQRDYYNQQYKQAFDNAINSLQNTMNKYRYGRTVQPYSALQGSMPTDMTSVSTR